MYDQNVVTFIHQLIDNAIKETNRLTSLYNNIISNESNKATKGLIIRLKHNFSPFLDHYINMIEEIIKEAVKFNVNMYISKLDEISKAIIIQFRRLELDTQATLAATSSWNDFKNMIENYSHQLLFDLHKLKNDSNNELTKKIEQSFMSVENKIDYSLRHLGITNDDILKGIRQVINIFQYNLLDQIGDKISILIYFGSNMTRLISTEVINRANIKIKVDNHSLRFNKKI